VGALIGDILSSYFHLVGKTERYTNSIDEGGTGGVLYKSITVLLDEFQYPVSRQNIRKHIKKRADELEFQRIIKCIVELISDNSNRHIDEFVNLARKSIVDNKVTFQNKPVNTALLHKAFGQVVTYAFMPMKKYKPTKKNI